MKLYYFELYALGEQIRMLLNHSKTPFKDNRISFGQWGVVKATMPNGQMPLLEVTNEDGTVTRLHQAQSIMRYLGKEKGYYPKDDSNDSTMKGYKIDAIVDDISDFKKNMPISVMYRGPPMNNMDLVDMLNGYKRMFTRMEEYLSSSSGKFLVGDTPTIADFSCFAFLGSGPLNLNGRPDQQHVYKACNDLLQKHTACVAWVDVMMSELDEYMKTRPTGIAT